MLGQRMYNSMYKIGQKQNIKGSEFGKRVNHINGKKNTLVSPYNQEQRKSYLEK